MGETGKTLNDIPAMLGYTSLATFIYQLRIKFLNQFFLFTGGISYALFLTHILILSLVSYGLPFLGWQMNLIIIIITLFLTYLFSYFYNQFMVRYL